MRSRQALVTVGGFTQASSVIAFVRCNEAASGIDTRELDPLKLNALPYFPNTQLVFATVPLLLFPDRSATVVPAPASNEYAATKLDVGAGVVPVPVAVAVLL